MVAKMNFMIGRGELLTSSVTIKSSSFKTKFPYSLEEAVSRLEPQFVECSSVIDTLPAEACPYDLAVELFTLNPDFLAKSYYPIELFKTLRVEAIGSKSIHIIPRKRNKDRPPEESLTTQLYLASTRSILRSVSDTIKKFSDDSKESEDLRKIESISLPDPISKSVGSVDQEMYDYFEIALNLFPSIDVEKIQIAFFNYADLCSVKYYNDLSFRAGNLWFIPVFGKKQNILDLAKFTFVRVLRKMPKLRGIPANPRSVKMRIKASLSEEPPVSNDIRVAIMDGGLPENNPIKPWVTQYYKADNEAEDIPEYNEHGLGVSSAFLFGPLQSGKKSKRPYAPITNIRVLDAGSNDENPLELYRTLGMIEEVLLSRQYDFINLSLGPDLPVEDQDVHAWTSVIDEKLSDGSTFMTVAVGNNGEADRASGNARIQVPADCVNALAVGATDKETGDWKRAPYSALGPGRLPGIIKPDLTAFGGSPGNYFHVLTEGSAANLTPNFGTSFAAPYLLRTAVGVRAYLGEALSILGIKALLIHCADTNKNPILEVGWGKITDDITSLVVCPDSVTRIVYQGELRPAKYLRASIPYPKGIQGNVTVKATICFATEVDPEDSGAYTRAGLEIRFRPNIDKVKTGATHPKTKSFFNSSSYEFEEDLRSFSGKWETVLHAESTFRANTLNKPSFDIHYTARENCGKSFTREKIRYALIISLIAPKTLDVGQRILDEYPQLVPIQPRITIQEVKV